MAKDRCTRMAALMTQVRMSFKGSTRFLLGTPISVPGGFRKNGRIKLKSKSKMQEIYVAKLDNLLQDCFELNRRVTSCSFQQLVIILQFNNLLTSCE